MHKLSKKCMALLLAVIMSFSLVIPSVSAKGTGDDGDPVTIEAESEIQEYASPGDYHYVNGRSYHAGTIYTTESGATYEEGIFYDVTEGSDTNLYCVEFNNDFSAGYATVYDATSRYDSTTLAQLAIGTWYIENTYGNTYNANQIYLLQNIYVWRVLENWAYHTYTDSISQGTQDAIFSEAWSFANSNISAFDCSGLVYDMTYNTQDVGVFYAEPDEPSQITLAKSSSNSSIVENNTCYSLAGAVYNIYTDSTCNNIAYTSDGNQAVLTTTSDGTTNTVQIDAGTYYIKEVTASKGYGLDTTVHTVTVEEGKSVVVYSQDPPVNDPVVLEVNKVSNETTSDILSLEGAEFTVKFYGGNYSIDEINSGKPSSDGVATRTWVIKTIDNGGYYEAYLNDDCFVSGDDFYRESSGAVILPLGTITIEETKAPEGYTLNGGYSVTDSYGNIISDTNGVICLHVENLNNVGTISTGNAYTKEDTLIRGGVEINKKDYETQENVALGDANLQAIFTIYNENSYAVTVNGEDYDSGEAVYSMTTDAETGYATTSNDLLPYGHYKIVETKLPEGYTGEGITEQEFNIKDDGVIVDLTGDNAIFNQVVRADFEIHKTDDNGEPMANVEFSITSETTGETHYFVTDEDGYYSSSSDYVLHSDHTNESRNQVKAHEGIWFGEGTEVNDDLGALPYDTYTISEIRTEDANWSYVMQEQTFTVTGGDNNIVIDLDVVNPEMRIVTEALFTDINSHYHIADGVVTVVDVVSYENLLANHRYYIETFLYDVTTGEFIDLDEDGYHSYDSQGNKVYDIVTTIITTNDDKGDGTTDGEFRVEFELDLSQFEGHQIVVYEDVYDTNQASLQPPYVCEENPEDAMQTLYIPEIHTTALDSETGNHMSYCDDDITIIDTVDYTNLEVGAEYTVYGTLMNKDTGEVVLDKDGNEIVAETTFVPETKDGSVDVVFEFDGTGLDGIVTVVFEDLYSEDIEYAVHTDINDEGQTIYIPKIHTLAWSEETGTNLATPTADTVLYDTVWYSGLKPDEDYHVFGVLLDAETRQAELDSDGNEIYSDYGPFTAESTEGQVTVEYHIDASQLAGRKTVFFEILYHVDYEDENVVEEILDELENEDIGVEEAINEITEYSITTYASDTETDDYFILGMGDLWYYTGSDNSDAIYGTIEGVTGWWYVPRGVSGMRSVSTTYTGTVYLYVDGETHEVIDGLIQDYGDIEEPDVTEPGIEEPDDDGNSEPVIHTGTPIYTLVAEEDIADAEQETIYFPEIQTTAWDINTETHVTKADSNMTIIDTVEYTNLAIDKEYTVIGTLMDKATGEPMTDDNGNIITAETIFTPKATDGTVDVTFTFSGVTLEDTAMVAFEELYYEDTQLTVHTDINDDDQTVYVPKIHTTAINKDTGTHEGISNGTITIVDTIEYTNLMPGIEYTMSGELYNAETGESLGITAETTFMPETANGSTDVEFEFDASDMGDITIAVFEYCYYDGNLVTEHTDLNDTDQQVKLTPPEVPDENKPNDEGGDIQTGEIIALSVLGAIALAAVIVLIVTLSTRKRKA